VVRARRSTIEIATRNAPVGVPATIRAHGDGSALTAADDSGDPLGVVAGLFRMAHAFLRLRRPDQAEQAATSVLAALDPIVRNDDAAPEALSPYGAMHLVRAVIAARTATGQALGSAAVWRCAGL
jgi:hypothetical protein